MKKLDFNISASTLNRYITCPWSFKQDKILKRETLKVPAPPLIYGQAFHKLLESFYKKKTFSTYDLFKNWEKFFDIEVEIQKGHGLTQLKYLRASGFTMIKNWVAMAKENDWLHEAFGIELPFLEPYQNDRFEINVKGFMDLVIENKNKLYILDWKTGKFKEDDYTIQAIIYSWALYKKYNYIEESVRFVCPAKKENRIVDIKVKDDDYLLIKKHVDNMFDDIENDSFKRNKSGHCRWCEWIDCKYNQNENAKSQTKFEVIAE